MYIYFYIYMYTINMYLYIYIYLIMHHKRDKTTKRIAKSQEQVAQ